MILTSLLLLAFTPLQSAPEPARPIIQNERVTVWDLARERGAIPPAELSPYDTLTIYLTGPQAGTARFDKKGSARKEQDGRAVVVALKDHVVPPMPNKSGYPNAFPRPNVKKLIENDRILVWDYTWTPGVPSPMHFHDKDVVVVYFEDGALKSVTPDGKSVVNDVAFGMIRFNLRDRSHYEEVVKGKSRAIMMELK